MTESAKIQEKLLELMADGMPHAVQEMKRHLEQTGITGYSEGKFAGSINTLQRQNRIKKTDRATYVLVGEQERGRGSMKCCFVVSPIGAEGTEVRSNADKLVRHIIDPVCRSCGFQVERVDQMNDMGSITQTIIDKLKTAELVIADISEHNPNVFFEMGYRTCTGKPIIHLRKKGERIPFDVNTIRTFEYDLTDLDSVEAIKDRLQQTISAFSFDADGEDEPDTGSQNDSAVSKILPVLYEIQDSIARLREDIDKKDTETIQTIMQTSLNNAVKAESPETTMMKILLPELIKDPNMMANMMKISDMANKGKKK